MKSLNPLSEDLAKLDLIAQKTQELEASIPPKRTRRKAKSKPKDKSVFTPKRRINHKEQERYKSAARFFNNLKPKYQYKTTKSRFDETKTTLDQSKPCLTPNLSTKLAQASTKSWKGHVITTSDYSQLVAQVKHRWDDIDVELCQGFIRKNIAYETARFSLEDEPITTSSFINEPLQSYKYIIPLV